MNFYFAPIQLEIARQKVEENHPTSLKALHDPSALDNAVLERLVDRLLSTPPDQFGVFVTNLSPLHQQLFSGLLVHENEDVCARCLACLKIKPSLAKQRYLWRGFCEGYVGDSALAIAKLVLGEVTLSRDFSRFELAMLRARVESPAASNQAFWKWVVEQRSPPERLRAEYEIPERSSFTIQLSFYLLMQGTHEMWLLESPDRIESIFARLPERTKVQVLKHVYECFRQFEEQRVAKFPQLAVLASKLRASDALSDALEVYHLDASRWWQAIVIRNELTNFLAKLSDNERFQFWEGYIPHMKHAWGDVANLRLFIDFDGFGLIEFGEVGNASYVYEHDDFEFYRKKGLDRTVGHGALKNQDRAIGRISHHSGWERTTRKRLRQWFARYNNTMDTTR